MWVVVVKIMFVYVGVLLIDLEVLFIKEFGVVLYGLFYVINMFVWVGGI